MACSNCDLHVHSDPTCIRGSGPSKAKIMIINSTAGETDEARGEATMTKPVLDFLNRAGINPSSVYYTNAIKCRVPKGTKIKVGDAKKCSHYLLDEIEKVGPKYVLLIGAQALQATVGGSITVINGTTIEKDGISYVPTYNPGIVYHDPGKAPFVEQALDNFMLLVSGQRRELPQLNIKIVKSMKDVRASFRYLEEHGYQRLSYDIESTGLDRYEDRVNLLGWGNDKVQYILPLNVRFSPLRGKPIAQRRLLRAVVNRLNKGFKLDAGNGKFDNLFIKREYGVKPRLDHDVVLGSHILDENSPNGVKENAIKECNALDWDIDTNLKQGKVKTQEDYNRYLTYLGYDIYYEYQLGRIQRRKIKEDSSLKKLFEHLYMPAIRAYEDIEEYGVFIYKKQFKEARKHLSDSLADIEKKLAKHKKGVNWSSPQQVAQLLYRELRLPIIELTDAGEPSTSEATLKQLREKHPVVDLILQHRGVKIQISHFIDGWINRMVDGRLHPNFKMHGTVTGRTSCTDPNLQQVPRDPKIRSLLGAPPGRTFVECDHSQAELRIATILSGDPTMTRIYQTGGDIHTHTYEMVSGEKISDDKHIKKEQRKKAKAVNFGFVYGMGWRKFKDYARDTYGIILTDKEAKEYREKFFRTYNKLPEWHQRQRKIVNALGQVRNPIGRLRRLPDIYSSDQGKKAEAERQAINSPVQGFGSDLTIMGMIEVTGYAKVYHKHLVLDKSRFDCIGTVHDATLFEVDDDYLMEFIPRVKEIMQNPKVLSDVFHFESPIPIVVDFSVGKQWSQGVELHFENDEWKNQIKEYLQSQIA